jgi:uncharacterized RDD family membrane protein YckC
LRDEVNVLQKEAPSLLKLGASSVYELLTVIAICLAGALVFIALFGDATSGLKRTALQLWLWLLVGSYYIVCWRKSGQTLAMQAWRLKLVNATNQKLGYGVLIKRYLLASLSLLCVGLGFLWALLDKNNAFVHDKCCATKVVVIPNN